MIGDEGVHGADDGDVIGVGGGFLLMPALVKFAKLPLRVATGTSLAVISFNSAAGFLSHYGEAPPRWTLAFVFAVIAALGVIVGSSFAKRLPVARLRQSFAMMGCCSWASIRDSMNFVALPFHFFFSLS